MVCNIDGSSVLQMVIVNNGRNPSDVPCRDMQNRRKTEMVCHGLQLLSTKGTEGNHLQIALAGKIIDFLFWVKATEINPVDVHLWHSKWKIDFVVYMPLGCGHVS